MRKVLFLILLCLPFISYSQSKYYIRTDTLVVEKINGSAELLLRNATRDSTGGLLVNIGGGRTRFLRARAINDSTFTIGLDTIVIRGATGGGGGSGINNDNIGAGFPWLHSGTQEIKTFFEGFGFLLDSVSNADGLTGIVDTAAFSKTVVLEQFGIDLTYSSPVIAGQDDTLRIMADTSYLKLATQTYLERYRREWVDNITGQFLIWDFTDATRITLNGSNLSNYNDLGSGNNDISVTTSGAQPPYSTSGGANNKPYVTVLSGDTLGVTTLSVATTPATFYVVGQFPALVDNERVFAYDDISGENGVIIETDRLYIYTGVSPFYGPDNRPAARTQWMVLKVILKDLDGLGLKSNNEVEIYSDGASNTTLTLEKLLFNYCPGIKISEVRGFNRVLTEFEDDRLQLYFLEKYQLEEPEKWMLGFGDSHLQGVMSGTTVTGGAMEKRLQDSTVMKIYNLAGSGAVMDDWGNGAFTAYSLKAQSGIYAKDKWRNAWLFFNFGTNDAANETGLSINWTTWEDNYVTYIQRFIDAGHDIAKMMISTPLYSTASYPAGNLPDAVTAIRNVSTRTGVYLIDIYQEMQDEGLDIDDVVGGDDIHGDAAIHQLWFEMVRARTEGEVSVTSGSFTAPGSAGAIPYNNGSNVFTADAAFIRHNTGLQVYHTNLANGGGISLTGSAPASNQLYAGPGFTIDLTSNGAGMSIGGAFDGGTSGEKNMLLLGNQVAYTSGNKRHNQLKIEGNISVTGTATGITTGITIDPLMGTVADWRSIDIIPDVGFAIRQPGTNAKNWFAGKVGLNGISTPSVSLHTDATDAWKVPLGTTAQRPTGAAGYFRYNNDSTRFEGYDGSGWKGIAWTSDAGGGSGEANTASNLGGGLANWDSKSGVDLRFNTFSSTDFDLASNLFTIDASIARLASPTFTGTPAAPTAAPGTNTTQIATMAALQAELNANSWFATYTLAADKTFAGSGSAEVITFDTEEAENAISHSTVTNPEEITLTNAGVYTISIDFSVSSTTAADAIKSSIQVWDGDSWEFVANTGALFKITGASETTMYSKSYQQYWSAGTKIRVVMSASSTDCFLNFIASGADAAAVPAARIVISGRKAPAP